MSTNQKYSFIEVIDSLDCLKNYAASKKNTRINDALKELERSIKDSRATNRDVITLLDLLKEDTVVEVNYDEYKTLTEYLILHDSGFTLEEVDNEMDYFLIKEERL